MEECNIEILFKSYSEFLKVTKMEKNCLSMFGDPPRVMTLWKNHMGVALRQELLRASQ